jgi:hypothetical protein
MKNWSKCIFLFLFKVIEKTKDIFENKLKSNLNINGFSLEITINENNYLLK